MAHQQNLICPRVAEALAGMARELRVIMYGPEAFPEWGTKFTDIELLGMDLGRELTRQFMEQAVQEQALQPPPDEALECAGEMAIPTPQKHVTTLETSAGNVAWPQPKTRLPTARRDFFPSGPSAGD